MICKSCAEAGDIRETNPEQAQEQHKLCPDTDGGGWCDCQHRVEGMLIRERENDG